MILQDRSASERCIFYDDNHLKLNSSSDASTRSVSTPADSFGLLRKQSFSSSVSSCSQNAHAISETAVPQSPLKQEWNIVSEVENDTPGTGRYCRFLTEERSNVEQDKKEELQDRDNCITTDNNNGDRGICSGFAKLETFILFLGVLNIFTDTALSSSVVPILPRELGLDQFHESAVLAVSSLTSTIFGPLCGWLSDTKGWAPTLMWFYPLVLVSSALLITARGSFWKFVGARLIGGIGSGFMYPSNLSMIVAAHHTSVRATAVGFTLAGDLGSLCGPLIGGFLYDYGGTSLLYTAMFTLCLFNTIIFIIALKKKINIFDHTTTSTSDDDQRNSTLNSVANLHLLFDRHSNTYSNNNEYHNQNRKFQNSTTNEILLLDQGNSCPNDGKKHHTPWFYHQKRIFSYHNGINRRSLSSPPTLVVIKKQVPMDQTSSLKCDSISSLYDTIRERISSSSSADATSNGTYHVEKPVYHPISSLDLHMPLLVQENTTVSNYEEKEGECESKLCLNDDTVTKRDDDDDNDEISNYNKKKKTHINRRIISLNNGEQHEEYSSKRNVNIKRNTYNVSRRFHTVLSLPTTHNDHTCEPLNINNCTIRALETLNQDVAEDTDCLNDGDDVYEPLLGSNIRHPLSITTRKSSCALSLWSSLFSKISNEVTKMRAFWKLGFVVRSATVFYCWGVALSLQGTLPVIWSTAWHRSAVSIGVLFLPHLILRVLLSSIAPFISDVMGTPLYQLISLGMCTTVASITCLATTPFAEPYIHSIILAGVGAGLGITDSCVTAWAGNYFDSTAAEGESVAFYGMAFAILIVACDAGMFFLPLFTSLVSEYWCFGDAYLIMAGVGVLITCLSIYCGEQEK